MKAHKPIRDKVCTAEKKLAVDLKAARYDVMNEVRCNAPLDEEVYDPVHGAFEEDFPGL